MTLSASYLTASPSPVRPQTGFMGSADQERFPSWHAENPFVEGMTRMISFGGFSGADALEAQRWRDTRAHEANAH
jgi:hypothetical protein